MINVQRLILFSVYQNSQCKAVNESNHELHIDLFKKRGLKFKEVEGIYKGTTEKSFLVIINNENDEHYIKFTAKLYNQECIICRDAQNNWYLEDSTGKITNFERGLLVDEPTDNCTKIDNKYFVLR